MTEVMDLVNRVDSRWVGVLFDYGNAIPVYEDPMHALQLCTDKLFGVHLKDQVICKTGEENELEYCMSETGVGEGACDVIGLSKYIMEHTTLDRLNVETSFPYAGRFTRPVGTGGVTKLGEGAFSFAEPPMPMEKVKPLHYYSYGGEYLDEMIEMQMSLCAAGLIISTACATNLKSKAGLNTMEFICFDNEPGRVYSDIVKSMENICSFPDWFRKISRLESFSTATSPSRPAPFWKISRPF